MKRVAIDIVPIRVGEGGTGSGIWTYARELLLHMDELDFQGLHIVVLANKGQRRFLAGLRNFCVIEVPFSGKNILFRLLWGHVLLPFICLLKHMDVLHKLATETPLLCPAKRVTTVHDFYYEFLLENHSLKSIRLHKRLENLYFSLMTRTCFRKSVAIIAVSEVTRQEATQRYPESEARIQVIHNGAPSPELSTANFQPKMDDFNILCVAKFMEHKGQHLLIDAFEMLLEEDPELADSVRLTLRGFHNDAEYYDMIQQKVLESRFAPNIQLIPYNAGEGVKEIYADASLVVLLSDYEGFGFPILEAQAVGLPVLCSDLPVLHEVGAEGAVYVDRHDSQGIACAIRKFMDEPGYLREQQRKAKENVAHFSWGKTAKQTMQIYRQT